ncbi:hypothetical protein J8J27_25085, partial [Mycobacterium tuberculosis]|nr:hypothetical protein [Mycobacterium tuberculosis]
VIFGGVLPEALIADLIAALQPLPISVASRYRDEPRVIAGTTGRLTAALGAAARIDADVVWLGHGPDDAVTDFGFSKNGDDTLKRWGEAVIVERLVRAFRAERPD